ncbi:MAG: glutaredoxin family protein [Rhodanobacter sp.]
MPVTVYSKPDCPQCEHTKRDMDILGITYQTIDLTSDKAQLQRLVQAGYRTAPIVETDVGAWSGYNREKIRELVSST